MDKTVAGVFEAVLYRSPSTSTSCLGLDKGVRRVRDIDGRLQYQFMFFDKDAKQRPRVYQTTRTIWTPDNPGYPGFNRKSMRVFEVRRVLANPSDPERCKLGPTPHVLRDYWPEPHMAANEKDKQTDIIDALRREGLYPEMECRFLDILEDGEVWYPETGSRGSPVMVWSYLLGELPHYRGVYGQLCTDLYKVDNPALFFHAMSQVVDTLRHFKHAGYVHADVSPGNFLIRRRDGQIPASLHDIKREDLDDWTTIVSDLEWSRSYYSASQDYKGGTYRYMSTEWYLQSYRHNSDQLPDESTGEQTNAPITPADPTHEDNFIYNPYHDLEAVLWMAYDYILNRIPQRLLLTSAPDRTKNMLYKLQCFYKAYFKTNAEGIFKHERFRLMEADGYSTPMDLLKEIYPTDPVLELFYLALDMRISYMALEGDGVEGSTVTLDDGRTIFSLQCFRDEVYDSIEKAFRKVSDYYLDHPDIFCLAPPRAPRNVEEIPKQRLPREESDLISGRTSVGSPAACNPNLAWVIAEWIWHRQPLHSSFHYLTALMGNYGQRARDYHKESDYGKRTLFIGNMLNFFIGYMPRWRRSSDDDVRLTIDELREKGVLNKSYQWAPLRRRPAKNIRLRSWQTPSDAVKQQRLQGIKEIVEKILVTRTTTFRCGMPNRPMPSRHSEDAHHGADAAFVRADSPASSDVCDGGCARNPTVDWLGGQSFFTADTVAGGVFTTSESKHGVRENAHRVLTHAASVFWSDARHLTTFSFTIENTLMRIWCHTRTHSACSPVFDINDDPQWLIHFVLFVTYSPLPDLGFDPSVRRVKDVAGKLQYQFLCDREDTYTPFTYQTTRIITTPIADYPGYNLKCMTVFEVQKVLDNAEDPNERELMATPAVLRDYWDDNERRHEIAIQKDIKEKMDAAGVLPAMQGHFMDILEDGIVQYFPDSGDEAASPPAEFTVVNTRFAEENWNMFHMRGVYKQLCVDLGSVDNPALFFHALSQVARILMYMKRAGYLHKDVSLGNFLLHHVSGLVPPSLLDLDREALEQWTTIITDLEFARPYLDAPVNERYILCPSEKNNFVTNFYHDLESVYWAFLAYILYRVSQTRLLDGMDNALLGSFRIHNDKFFDCDVEGNETRLQFLKDPSEADFLCDDLAKVYGNDHPILDAVRLVNDLRDAYNDLEQDTSQTTTLDDGRVVYAQSLFQDDIYLKMERAFRKISDHYVDHPDQFVRLPPTAPPLPTTRPPRLPACPAWQLAESKNFDKDGPGELIPEEYCPIAHRTKRALKRLLEDGAPIERPARRARLARAQAQAVAQPQPAQPQPTQAQNARSQTNQAQPAPPQQPIQAATTTNEPPAAGRRLRGTTMAQRKRR
ncbi:uncharacterized protein SCHCODRAFT_02683809 [Schizophyllum commune H4-8]|uniref:uncharacterized protein n=1 Tax=Schizophyllum commune (strain H4-8 / FGSC 9210) TaxID=578458 RepID=UPI002160BEAE|nr:uncharacterized protein SCHCODRAFT_02683809 [Schizophyllum commune H4-8]KAI5897493.1 hypothetical protein SCHCODRAFT_02683809 [Schizophyllum commune H4-8]